MPSSATIKTIPNLVAHNSNTNPDGPFYIYSDPTSSELVTITHLEFGRAVDRAAHILRPHSNGSDGDVVAIIALSDTILYHAILVALVTANLIPFPISPRNSPSAVVHLLRMTSCHRIVATCTTLEPLVGGIKQEFAQVDPDFVLNIEEVPALSQIYPNLGAERLNHPFNPYTPPSTTPALDDLCLYLHSSGSTGHPKAIPQAHRAFVQLASLPAMSEVRDEGFYPMATMALPSFHTLGLYCQLLQPLNGNYVAVYPPTALFPSSLPVMLSPSNVLEHCRKTNCTSLMGIPALYAGWARSSEAVAYLKTLRVNLWAAGPLPERVGNFLQDSGVKLRGIYGSTETGPMCFVTALKGDEHEWQWYRFIEPTVQVRWVPQGNGTFECQLLSTDNHRVIVDNLPDTSGYATSDLFINHPEKKYLWKFVGRIDDVIVHLSGEKTVPAPMEDIVLASPDVTGAVIFGSNQNQTGILIEPRPDLSIDVTDINQFAELRNKIWHVVEEANRVAPAFSRIFKEMIIFTSLDKPLPRAGKGTVQRKPALDLYSCEIDALYGVVAQNTSIIESIKLPTIWQAEPIKTWLVELAADLCNGAGISTEADLFQQGFDSLSATIFRIRIMGALRSCTSIDVQKASEGVTQNLVYSHPTISKLSTYLAGLIDGSGNEENVPGPEVLMQEMITKYTSGLPQPTTPSPCTVVLLTGSTGNLGSHILASLLQNEKVAKVYALNRPSSSSESLAQRHLTVFKGRDLATTLLTSPKLYLVEGRTEQPNLAINSKLYNEIRSSVTLIIHNAWQLDFNLTLGSFSPHVAGTRHLVDLALSSAVLSKIVFTSSIAAIGSGLDSGPIPHEITYASVGALGYGQSKFVAEQVINRSGLHTASLRIGQLYGGLPKGVWSTTDWFPILVKTSMTLGHLPLTNGLVSWLDFETAAQAVVDVAFAPLDSVQPSRVFPVVNPRPVPFNFVIAGIRDAILKHCSVQLQLVSFAEWYASLESVAASHSSKRDHSDAPPGIKLLGIFSRLANLSVKFSNSQFTASELSTEEIQALSVPIRTAEAVTSENAESWVRYWKNSGFL
ncbi:putative aminoadipate reductase [Mycena galericulata]|nr:putative aminoadipate reductase [Mycena galericulata]